MIIDNRPTRERVLDAIETEPGITTTEIAAKVYLTANAVGHHLRALERDGKILRSRGEGNAVYWDPK